MLNKLTKTAKFLTGWLNWATMYPLWHDPKGRVQVIRYILQLAKQYPAQTKEVQRIADAIIAQETLRSILERLKKAGVKGDFGDMLAEILGGGFPGVSPEARADGDYGWSGPGARGKRDGGQPAPGYGFGGQDTDYVPKPPFHLCESGMHFHDADDELVEFDELPEQYRKDFPDIYGGGPVAAGSAPADADDDDEGFGADFARGMREGDPAVPGFRPPYERRGVDLHDADGKRIPHPTEMSEEELKAKGGPDIFARRDADGVPDAEDGPTAVVSDDGVRNI